MPFIRAGRPAGADGDGQARREPAAQGADDEKDGERAAALTAASLFTTPEMKANMGWNATNSPAATAGQCGRGNSSRTSSTAHAAVRPPKSAVISRIAVRRDQIEPPAAR